MPTYVYALAPGASAQGCGKCRGSFEVIQKMSDEPLAKCPACGAPVQRRIQAPLVGHDEKLKGPSDKTLAAAGFTKFKRSGKGQYEKLFGSGPSRLGG
jgi:putative FmdB family regulatory protein